MSWFFTLSPRTRAARVFGSGLALALTAACHQRSSVPRGLSTPDSGDTANVSYGPASPGKTGRAARSVAADELKNIKVERVEELLVGRFPGVHVQPTPAGGFLVRIRGATMPGDREPLYVVDGLPVEVTSDRGLDWLNPADIARIEIVKDPAGTSMYGGRGANGVVLIFTKQQQR